MQWIKQKLSSWIGKEAEDQACRFLQQKGLTLVTQNYRCRTGEIDLVMRDGEEWVFIEVKYRKSNKYGHASEFLDRHKRRKLESAVLHFLQQHDLNPAHIAHRIDLVAIQGQEIQWISHI
ncbi:YraN family protein [Aliiglaciecola sp. CAU 1673]|uniref:YraN family protein n=1 Tax=Aliiglaciecola sp. CAU 1673 TaxID=3032595 RepID=UPI0023D9E124|nr:YraN family protein [Aliiglaciecola sp. CAU 1673]MDF2178450.1 YraN family protein [Aliiglaciecola sp. CAU 1673]